VNLSYSDRKVVGFIKATCSEKEQIIFMEVLTMDKVKIILNNNNLEAEIRELKLSFHNDTCSSHKITKELDEYENEHVIIELFYKDNYHLSSKDIFFGKVVQDKLYIARHLRVPGLYEPISVYDEFISTGEELKFNY
jgi:hypothetical protein